MAKYQLRIKKSAEKELAQLPVHYILSIRNHIVSLADTPFPSGYKKLKGFKNLYRTRIGDYRVIYTVEQSILIIEILKIGNRKDVYK
ncbi:MAG: type II toxin-antitoxin system RelE/ParE family toxin [Sphingobacteriales bacterium]|nr:type II toxin-antitoxin system RelE/ParE family toxin [Sphingobacteriales bacterium]MBI3718537.1 type II toxin-antitoxin system RelE/ParE family toxin [Sphingobacteriales bacterium]